MNTLNGYSKSTLTDKYVLTAAGGHLAVGNASGNIPLSNSTVNTNLNADLLDGINANGLLTALSSNTTSKVSLTVGGTTKNITTLYASYLCSVGTVAPLTGRTQAYGNVYSYHTTTALTGAPTTYTATIGFGKGTAGTVEICGEWTSGRGLWVRALRDVADNWYAWDRILTEATYSKVLDNRYYTETEVNTKLGDYVTLATAQNITGAKRFNKQLTVYTSAVKQTPKITFDEHYGPNWVSEIISDYYGTNVCTTDGFTHGLYIVLGRGNQFDNLNILDSTKTPIARISKDKGHYFAGTMQVTGNVTAPTFIGNLSGNATSANSATNIYVNQHTGKDIEYPLVWTNESNSSTKQSNLLYKSYNNLMYNPKNNRITASIFKGNLQGNINPFTSISYTAGTSTVKNIKDALVTAFNSVSTGIGANVIVPALAINYWSTESTIIQNSNVYSMIKIGGGYSGTTYGLWLLSTYASNRIGYVGRNNSTWDNIYWLATTNDIDTLKNYYWANVKISATSNAATTPTFATATATTQVTTPKVHSSGRLTLNATSTGVDLKFNNDNTKSVILNGTAFKPFDDANDKLTLGSASARWSTIYGVNSNFSGTVKMYTGDASLAIYSGRITDAKSDGNICFLTSIDNTDPQSHSYPTQHGARCNIVLQPRGGQVYIGTNPDGGNTSYKLYVNGGIFSTGFTKSGSSDSYVLLGGGGHKAVSDFWTGTRYWANVAVSTSSSTTTTPTFAKVSISNSAYPLMTLTRSGSTYGALIAFANSNGTLGHIGMTGAANGGLYRYSADASISYLVCDANNSSVSGGGSSWGSSITVKIAGTSKTLTIPSNPNTWRPITNSYSGTATDTSLSLKGANDLYNAVIGSIPTVNNGKITIKLNGTEIGSFTMNQSSAGTINLTDTTYGLVGANGTTGLIKNGSTVTTTTGYIACPIINGVPYYWDTTLGNSGVTAGTYTPTPSTVTNSTNQSIQVPELTINASGLITKASLKNVAITGSFYIASNKTLTNSELSFITSITIAPGYTVTFPTPSSSNEGKIIFVKAAYGNQARYVSGKIAACNSICSTASTTTIDIGYHSHIFVCMDYGSGYAWVDYYCG